MTIRRSGTGLVDRRSLAGRVLTPGVNPELTRIFRALEGLDGRVDSLEEVLRGPSRFDAARLAARVAALENVPLPEKTGTKLVSDLLIPAGPGWTEFGSVIAPHDGFYIFNTVRSTRWDREGSGNKDVDFDIRLLLEGVEANQWNFSVTLNQPEYTDNNASMDSGSILAGWTVAYEARNNQAGDGTITMIAGSEVAIHGPLGDYGAVLAAINQVADIQNDHDRTTLLTES